MLFFFCWLLRLWRGRVEERDKIRSKRFLFCGGWTLIVVYAKRKTQKKGKKSINDEKRIKKD